jgi:hypothetical protein
VSGAYYHGEIQSVEDGGVTYFAHIPPGWGHFGYGGICASTSRRMCLRVRRAIKGLIVAGAEWEKVNTVFLISISFTKSCVDRRVFFLAATPEIPDGMMALAVLVDDTFVVSVNKSVKARVKAL